MLASRGRVADLGTPERVERWARYGLRLPRVAKALRESRTVTGAYFDELLRADSGDVWRQCGLSPPPGPAEPGTPEQLEARDLVTGMRLRLVGVGQRPKPVRSLRARPLKGLEADKTASKLLRPHRRRPSQVGVDTGPMGAAAGPSGAVGSRSPLSALMGPGAGPAPVSLVEVSWREDGLSADGGTLPVHSILVERRVVRPDRPAGSSEEAARALDAGDALAGPWETVWYGDVTAGSAPMMGRRHGPGKRAPKRHRPDGAGAGLVADDADDDAGTVAQITMRGGRVAGVLDVVARPEAVWMQYRTVRWAFWGGSNDTVHAPVLTAPRVVRRDAEARVAAAPTPGLGALKEQGPPARAMPAVEVASLQAMPRSPGGGRLVQAPAMPAVEVASLQASLRPAGGGRLEQAQAVAQAAPVVAAAPARQPDPAGGEIVATVRRDAATPGQPAKAAGSDDRAGAGPNRVVRPSLQSRKPGLFKSAPGPEAAAAQLPGGGPPVRATPDSADATDWLVHVSEAFLVAVALGGVAALGIIVWQHFAARRQGVPVEAARHILSGRSADPASTAPRRRPSTSARPAWLPRRSSAPSRQVVDESQLAGSARRW